MYFFQQNLTTEVDTNNSKYKILELMIRLFLNKWLSSIDFTAVKNEKYFGQ